MPQPDRDLHTRKGLATVQPALHTPPHSSDPPQLTPAGSQHSRNMSTLSGIDGCRAAGAAATAAAAAPAPAA
eukprot:scaffold161034_cov14-Tisochrysis_lutea.AAC.1